jgi:hypothetical protein
MLPQSPISILKKTKSSRSCDRSVNFFDCVRVVETLHRNDFSQQELDDYWSVYDEYWCMKQDIRNTVKLFNQNMYIDEAKYCLRGIEHKIETRRGLSRKIRLDAQMVVLDEQEIQHDLGFCNESMIRSVYRMHSHRCAVAAHRKGLEDERLAVPPAIINLPMRVCNESIISSVYRIHSHRCAVAAHRKGLEDKRLAVPSAIINLPKTLGAVGRPSGMVGPWMPHSMVPTAA